MVGTGATRTEDCVMLAKAAKAAGADFLLVNSPPYAVPTDEENAIHALQIDQAAKPAYHALQTIPAVPGLIWVRSFLDRVGRSNNFCGIKESSGDINRVHLLAHGLSQHRAVLRHGRSGA